MGEKKVVKSALKTLMKEAQDRFPSMNSGGCGVFAGEVCKVLSESGLDAEVITSGEPPKLIRERLGKKATKAGCTAWDREGLDRGHLAVRVKLGKKFYTFDSESLIKSSFEFGVHKRECSYPFGQGLTYKETRALAADNHGIKWNEMFDRSQIPAVKKMVKTHLKPIKGLNK